MRAHGVGLSLDFAGGVVVEMGKRGVGCKGLHPQGGVEYKEGDKA